MRKNIKLKDVIIKYKWQLLCIAFITFSIFLVYGDWFSSLKIIARGDWKARSTSWIKDWFNIPFAWDTGDFGGNPFIYAGRIVRYPIYFLQAFLNKIFLLPYAITERLLWFIPFIIAGGSSIYLLTKKIFSTKTGAFIAVFIFLFNNFFLFRANGAQMVLLVSASLTPLVILFFIKTLKEDFFKNFLLTITFFAFITYNDIRLAALTFFVICSYSVYIILIKRFTLSVCYKKIKEKRVVFSIIFILISLIILNAFWFFPLISSKQNVASSDASFSGIETIENLSRTNFFHTLSLSMGDDNAFGNYVYIPGQINKTLLLVLPLVIILGIFFKKNRTDLLFFFGIYLLFAFLAKGLNPPFIFLNKFFYDFIPLSSMFRLPDKFLYIMATSFAMLYGVGASEILKKTLLYTKKHTMKVIWIKFLVIGIFSIIPLYIIYPAILGNQRLSEMRGGSSFKSEIPKQYFTLEKWLNSQEANYKTIWPMGTPRYTFFNYSHPRFELLTANQKDSLFASVDYSGENFSLDYLKNTKNFDKIMALVNVRYFMLPPKNDPDWSWQPDYKNFDSFKKTIESNDNLNLSRIYFYDKNIFVYENKEALPKIHSGQKNILILGGGKALNYLLSEKDFKINDWNIFFIENFGKNFSYLKDNIDMILFFKQNTDDLLLGSIEEKYRVKKSASDSNYYRKLVFDGEIKSNNYSLSEKRLKGIKNLEFSKQIYDSGPHEIWIRIANSDYYNNCVSIYHKNEKINDYFFNNKFIDQYKWFEISNINLTQGINNFKLEFCNKDIAIDDIVIIPEDKIKRKKEELNQYLSDKKLNFFSLVQPKQSYTNENTGISSALIKQALLSNNLTCIKNNGEEVANNIYEIGYIKNDKKKNIFKIISSGFYFQEWKNDKLENIINNNFNENKGIITSTNSSVLSKNITKTDFSNYSKISIRIKESSPEQIKLTIRDVNKNSCSFNFISSSEWKTTTLNLSDCKLNQKRFLDWKNIDKVSFFDIYKNYTFFIDHIYLINETASKNIKKEDSLWYAGKNGNDQFCNINNLIYDLPPSLKKICIYHSGMYTFNIRFYDKRLLEDNFKQIRIDGDELNYKINANQLSTDSLFLDTGCHELEIPGLISKYIEYIKIIKKNSDDSTSLFKINKNSIKIISWNMISPSKYHILAKVNRPAFIGLLDGYDKNWVLKYNNKSFKSIPLTSINNGFLVIPEKEGAEIEMYLEYEPQFFMNIGFSVFLSGWIAIFIGLIYSFFYKKI